jgi:hypothetical protein
VRWKGIRDQTGSVVNGRVEWEDTLDFCEYLLHGLHDLDTATLGWCHFFFSFLFVFFIIQQVDD